MAAVSLVQRFLDIPGLGLATIGLVETDLQLAAERIAKEAASLGLLDKNVDLMCLVVLYFDQSPMMLVQGGPHFVGKLWCHSMIIPW